MLIRLKTRFYKILVNPSLLLIFVSVLSNLYMHSGAYDYIKSRPDIVINGFKAAGV